MASDHPDGLVIDSTGADHLHGGEAAFAQNLVGLVKALASSKSDHFDVEVPMLNISERFSLLGARKTLGAKGDFVKECLD